MFGHVRGAFTGALVSNPGKFSLAAGGTLLLDEIGEMPLALQPKLLRVLQEREFYRLGDTRPLHVDVRVIATTNRSLRLLVEEGCFREDLYYRLNVIPLALPPLRERGEDVIELAEYFAAQVCCPGGAATPEPRLSGARCAPTPGRVTCASWPTPCGGLWLCARATKSAIAICNSCRPLLRSAPCAG